MATRRGKGEGSITRRKDGRWEARIDIGASPSGKRIIKSVYGKTKAAVTTELTKLAHRKIDGSLTTAGRMTTGEFLDKWLEASARLNVSPTTYARYESLIRLHIKPQLASVKLASLQPLHVQGMLSKLDQLEAGAETRRYALQVLRTALNVAKDWDLIGRNPCDKITSPKVTSREIAPLELDQIKDLMTAAASHRLRTVFVLAITSGLRQGELFGLQWADIDFAGRTLAVRHTLEEIKGQLRLKEPKSKAGRRLVRLPAVAINALMDHKAEQEAEGLEECSLVFCDSAGQFLRKSNFERRVWKPLRKAAGIAETVTFHDLRHTSASLLLRAASHPKIVQERLGHSTIKLTLDRYSHLMKGMQDEAAQHFDRLPALKQADCQSIVSQTGEGGEVSAETADANHCEMVA